MLTIEDLGVLRSVEVDGDRATVTLTPTYSGCPAMDAMRDDVILALNAAGYGHVEVRMALAPAWTTDWMTDAGKRKLTAYGIAPPTGRAALQQGIIRLQLAVKCPRCGSLRHARGRAVRVDVVQGAVRVPRLPRAVRSLQGDLT